MKNSLINLNAIITCILIISACSDIPAHSNLTILPQDCILPVSNEISLTLSGPIEPNSKIEWQANLGSIVNNSTGFTAIYVAPSVSGQAMITAKVISSSTNSVVELTLTCRIIDPNYSPTQTSTPIPIGEITATPLSAPTIIISEVMGNPCGDLSQRKYNQYVELYNYGSQPIDVNGWWLFDEGEEGTPDRLTSWNTRSTSQFEDGVIVNSTFIPAGGIAVVLSPLYLQNTSFERAPYHFPQGTIILTVLESDTIGDNYFGIIADQDGYDTLTLYTGGSTIIENVIDTYGTPNIINRYPIEIQDDFKDNIPRYLGECTSIERINPLIKDSESNWKPVLKGSPGAVPFNK